MAVRAICVTALRVMLLIAFNPVVPASAQAVNAAGASSRTVADIQVLLASRKPDLKRIAELRGLLDSAPPAGLSNKDLARHYVRRADAADELGDERQALEAMERVEELGGALDPDWESGYRSDLRWRMGGLIEAEHAIKARFAGSRLANLCAIAKLVDLYSRTDPDEAARWLSEAESRYFRTTSNTRSSLYRYRLLGCMEAARASYLLSRGKLAEAEAALRKSIDEFESGRSSAAIRARDESQHFQVLGEERQIMQSATELVRVIAKQNRLLEAETVLRSYLRQAVEKFGGHTTTVINQLTAFATLLSQQGRHAEAEQMARVALRILGTLGAPSDSLRAANARVALASTLVAQRRYADAMVEYTTLRAELSRQPGMAERLLHGEPEFVLALIRTGRETEALAILEQRIAQSRKLLGDEHPDTAELRGLRAVALAGSGAVERALSEYRAVLPALIGAAEQAEESPALRTNRLQLMLVSYVGLMGDIRGTSLEHSAGVDAASEAFRMADVMRSNRTQAAVAASAARAAAKDPAIGTEIRKEQDLGQELAALSRILRDMMALPVDKQLPKVIADMQKRIETIRRDQKNLRADLERRFPAYANLIRPQAPSIAQVREVLASNEAVISLFSTDTGTYVWAFRREGPVAFVRTALAREEAARLVQSLRSSLDPGDVDIASALPEFDLAGAHSLYARLLQPVAPGWQGARSLLVIASGVLSQLPLALLPTAAIDSRPVGGLRYAHYQSVPWLIRDAAITQLPTVNALVALRRLSAPAATRDPFVGFGDPQFSLKESKAPGARVAGSLAVRNLAIARVTQQDVEGERPVEWMDYGMIPPLPDTREEILSLARALKADPDKSAFLGARASKAMLKSLDLSRTRVVAFATHGLLPGDFPGVAEPSLALANPGDGQNGLLTLEEILGLKLNADWVVLSACNTAAGEGAGADAISGLGRGFFYAGTRALLATHWPVESASARQLVTGIFERQASDPALPRAEALRQSILSLMQAAPANAPFSYAHPMFWAPYVLIGDGASGGSR